MSFCAPVVVAWTCLQTVEFTRPGTSAAVADRYVTLIGTESKGFVFGIYNASKILLDKWYCAFYSNYVGISQMKEVFMVKDFTVGLLASIVAGFFVYFVCEYFRKKRLFIRNSTEQERPPGSGEATEPTKLRFYRTSSFFVGAALAILGIGLTTYSVSLSAQLKRLYVEADGLRRDGSYTEAIAKLDSLTSRWPDEVNAYIIKGRIYLEGLKQYQNAVVEFQTGLKEDPHNKYLLYDLGLAYYRLEDPRQAIKWNQKALDQDSNLIPVIYNHAIYYVEYGKKYENRSYYDTAIALYNEVINRDQEFAGSAMFNLAALYGRLRKEEKNDSVREHYCKEAVKLLDRAIEKEGVERYLKVTGKIYERYGEDLEAIRDCPDYKRIDEKWKSRFPN
jgi:tetratricopeptide (TPR) repeat protein